MERNMHRFVLYSRRECTEIAGIPSSVTNSILEEHVILIFQKLRVVMICITWLFQKTNMQYFEIRY